MNLKHGKSYSSTYRIWASMIARCTNPSSHAFASYGGRGITVCERWRSFPSFYKDMGDRPDGKSLERRENNGEYSPENCFWADRKTQNRNKRNNHLITLDGETCTIAEWAERCGLKYGTVHQRIRKGWAPEAAIRTPLLTRQDIADRKKTLGAENGVVFQDDRQEAAA